MMLRSPFTVRDASGNDRVFAAGRLAPKIAQLTTLFTTVRGADSRSGIFGQFADDFSIARSRPRPRSEVL